MSKLKTPIYRQAGQPDGKSPLLSIRDLEVRFETQKGTVRAVRGFNLDLYEGEILGLVGETGSGKSVSCKAITRLLPGNAMIKGCVSFRGIDLLKLKPSEMKPYRGKAISMIFQDPQGCLNPIKTIYSHLKEVLRKDIKKNNIRQTAEQQLKSMHINSPKKRLKDYPFQFSGGMAQRVQIAMAMTGDPCILIADEPTTALDVTIQARILNDLKELGKKNKLAVILVTHDLGVVAEICDRVAVMYHGAIVELGETKEVLSTPRHPYTQALLVSVPVLGQKNLILESIKGESLSVEFEIPGCDFADRCFQVKEKCRLDKPQLNQNGDHPALCNFPLSGIKTTLKQNKLQKEYLSDKVLLSVENLVCRFKLHGESGRKEFFPAVDDISFQIKKGEIFGVVGESGSGKSTLAKALMGLTTPFSGTLRFNDQLLFSKNWNFKEYTSKVQYVFQDPLGALDPRMSIISQVMEPLKIHNQTPAKDIMGKAAEALRSCGLKDSFFHRKPYNLSGGQRQRAVLARALINNPEFLICDEPVSAMDVSVQAQILNLLEQLANEKKMTVLFISHDLSVINNICDRVAVIFAGQIVEIGPMDTIFNAPAHPYTQLLIQSIPKIDFDKGLEGFEPMQKDEKMKGLQSSAVGCPFVLRCIKAKEICFSHHRPVQANIGEDHRIACHNV